MMPLPHRWPGWQQAAVVVFLVAHYAIAFTAMLDASATFDEVLHIASGLSYWKFDDYRLQPENGNLPQRWCALPLLAMGCSFPEDDAAWRTSDSFGLGRLLLYGSDNSPTVILASARAMAAVWSTALCFVIWLWSRSLFGEGGGMLSLGLAAFWPALVAHGPLATSDACGALFFTLGTWSLWNLVNRISVGSLTAACVSVALAAIAKHSCVLLVPLTALFVVIQAASRQPLHLSLVGASTTFTGRWGKAAALTASLIGPLISAMLVIWASCSFRYRVFAPGAAAAELFRFPTLGDCVGYAGAVGTMCDLLAAWRILPESWLWGMSQVVARSQYRYSFAIGRHSLFGWWWFFPLCLLIKNTLPALVLSGWGLCRAVAVVIAQTGRRLTLDDHWWKLLPLLLSLGLLWLTFLTSHLNIGERHLLPSYPPLVILAGGCWQAARSQWSRLLVCSLLGLHATDVLSRYPYTLAYFNQVVPRGAEYQWLVDSSLDWGQDLGRLSSWLEHRVPAEEPIYVTFSGAEPVEKRIPRAEILGFPRGWGILQMLRPGFYCVSASALQGVADRPRGPWCRTFEIAYRDVSALMQASVDRPDQAATVRLMRGLVRERDEFGLTTVGSPPTPDDLAVTALNILQAGRLKAFLRHRTPDASIGGSILVYHLDAGDIEQALHGSPTELEELSWFERERYGTADELVRQGRRYLGDDRPGDAIAVFESATRLYPGDPRAWEGLAVARRLHGDEAGAATAERRRDRLRARLVAEDAGR